MRVSKPLPMGPLMASAMALLLTVAAQPWAQTQQQGSRTVLSTTNSFGELRTLFVNGGYYDIRNPFFQNLGVNGRACVSCHVPADGWTISPARIQARFNATGGIDPIFRTVDGANSPFADCSTVDARRQSYSMLLNKGLIRVGLPVPTTAEFDLAEVDDPYNFASASELSLYRRPMPTANLRCLTGVMWDARETIHPFSGTPEQAAQALLDNLLHQGQSATTGHAQAVGNLTTEQVQQIVAFEMSIVTAQNTDFQAGPLDAEGAHGGPLNLISQPFYIGINDVLAGDFLTGAPFNSSSMTLYEPWANSTNPYRKQIQRGAVLFNTKPIAIKDVAGLNDDLHSPIIQGTCTTCHDSPNVGNHSVALPINIGLTDASRRTPDMPLYTLRNKLTGETKQTTDPGRALITGRWKDIGKFKGPILRGLASRAPYFHNGLAANFEQVVDFYDTRFGIGFNKREKLDLIAFLKTL